MLRRPGRKSDTAAWLQHPAHFRDGDVGSGRKHVTELAYNGIKLAIREWETFGVPLNPSSGSQRGYTRILPRNVEQGWRQVESRYRRSCASCRNRDDACARSNVEHGLAGFYPRELDEMRRNRCGESGSRCKRRPHLALAGL
jgi:hypothetical protein